MKVIHFSIVCLFASLLIIQVTAYQKDDGLEDYGPGPVSDDPNAPKDAKGDGAAGDAGLEPLPEEPLLDKTKTKFSDDRFAKLFPSRGAARPSSRTFQAHDVAKPKPTLPSFIKSTPPLLKATFSTTPAPRGNARARAVPQGTTRRPASTTTTARPRRGNVPTQRQLSGRLSTSAPLNQRPTPAPNSASTPSAAALAAARRLRQGSGISRFQRNQTPSNASPQANNAPGSTIPALNPRRN